MKRRQARAKQQKSSRRSVKSSWPLRFELLEQRLVLSAGIPKYTLDTAFGDNGFAKLSPAGTFVSGYHPTPLDVAIQGSGYVVAEFKRLSRHNSNGSLDTSFGSGGYVVTDAATAVEVLSDGSIVCAGLTPNPYNGPKLIIERYSAAGSLTASRTVDFGTNVLPARMNTGETELVRRSQVFGDAVDEYGREYDMRPLGCPRQSLAVQANDQVVVGMGCDDGFWLARLNSDLSSDNSFDNDGLLKVTLNTSAVVGDVACIVNEFTGQTDIIVAGTAGVAGSRDVLIARVGANANTVFRQLHNFGSDDIAEAIALGVSGKIVVAGTSAGNLLVAQFTPNGNLDTGFGTQGTFRDSPGPAFAHDVAVLSDGRVLVLGEQPSSLQVSPFRFYNYDWRLILLDTDGAVTNEMAQGYYQDDLAFAMAVLPNRTFVVVGTSDPYRFEKRNIFGEVTDFDYKQFEGENLLSRFLAPADADGDWLYDVWENSGGIDFNEDGVMDLLLPGCSPTHKDLYVEVDGMAGLTPTWGTLNRVVNAFAVAPVSNPDGVTGINLHIDPSIETIPRQAWTWDFNGNGWGPLGEDTNANGLWDPGEDVNVNFILDPGDPADQNPWVFFDQLKTTWFGDTAQRANPQAMQAKRLVYRYCIFADRWIAPDSDGIGVTDETSGMSRSIPGSDFIVSLGAWTAPGWNPAIVQDRQAGTFMHELGHTLGLTHGGVDHVNFKPNYYSIMSYLWQVPWVPSTQNPGGPDDQAFTASWFLDYSRIAVSPLDEKSLSEASAFPTPQGGGPAAINVSTIGIRMPAEWFDFDGDGQLDLGEDLNGNGVFDPGDDINGNGVLDGFRRLWVRPGQSVDWDEDGTIDSAPVRIDINQDPVTGPGFRSQDLLSAEDWSHLTYAVEPLGLSSSGAYQAFGLAELTFGQHLDFNQILFYESPTGNGKDDLVVRRNGGELQVFDSKADKVVASRLLADTRLVQIIGADGEDDKLTVDLRFGGAFTLRNGIEFDGRAGANDEIVIVDVEDMSLVDYLVTPTSVTSSNSPNAPSSQGVRRFPAIAYDASTERLRLEGTNGANTFDVQPSLYSTYFIDGNLPAPGTVCAKNGDYLKLDTKTTFPAHPQGLDTSGRKLTITSRGSGYWDFEASLPENTRHKRVEFESIERFNHVDIVAAGADAGTYSKPRVRVYDAETNELKFELPPEVTYGAAYRDGIRVATGDIDNDGLPDVVTAPGRLMAPIIKVFNGAPMVGLTNYNREIKALQIPASSTYGASFINGVQVAVGDVVGDCLNDIILVPSRGASLVEVFENRLAAPPVYSQWASANAVRTFNAFPDYPSFIGGATLAGADLNGNADGSDKQQIIVASGSGIRGLVRVFDVTTKRTAYSPLRQIWDPDAALRGGLNVSVGDVNGDGIPDIITGADRAGNAWVRIYDGKPGASNVPIKSFQAFTDLSQSAPVRVVARDIDGDGLAEIFVAQGADGRNNYQVKRYKGLTGSLVDACFAGCADFWGGGVWLG